MFIAAIALFILEMIVRPLLESYFGVPLLTKQDVSPNSFYIFLSETAFALVVGFLYLHVPQHKRSPATGARIGGIMGVLIALYQGFAWYGSFTVPGDQIFLGGIDTTVLAILCGVIISIVEKTINRRPISSGHEN